MERLKRPWQKVIIINGRPPNPMYVQAALSCEQVWGSCSLRVTSKSGSLVQKKHYNGNDGTTLVDKSLTYCWKTKRQRCVERMRG